MEKAVETGFKFSQFHIFWSLSRPENNAVTQMYYNILSRIPLPGHQLYLSRQIRALHHFKYFKRNSILTVFIKHMTKLPGSCTQLLKTEASIQQADSPPICLHMLEGTNKKKTKQHLIRAKSDLCSTFFFVLKTKPRHGQAHHFWDPAPAPAMSETLIFHL